MNIKSMSEIGSITAAARATMLKTTVHTARKAQKTVAKILTVAAEKGDFEDGEMNGHSLRITGVELRRELQGTYECVNVLKAIRGKVMSMTEKEFDDCPMFGCIVLSSFLAKSPEKVEPALAIIRKGEDVTKLLKELRNGEKPAKEKSPAKNEGAGDSPGTTPEIQVVDADTFIIPHEIYLVDHDKLMHRFVSEIQTADAQSLDSIAQVFGAMTALIAKRHSEIAASAKPAKEASKEKLVA